MSLHFRVQSSKVNGISILFEMNNVVFFSQFVLDHHILEIELQAVWLEAFKKRERVAEKLLTNLSEFYLHVYFRRSNVGILRIKLKG